MTPPKRWFEESTYQSEIQLYENYLTMLSKNPNVLKTCNLYTFIKNDYSAKDYIDSTHLSVSGHRSSQNI